MAKLNRQEFRALKELIAEYYTNKKIIIELREENNKLREENAELKKQAVERSEWVPLEYDAYADGNPVWDLWECQKCGHEHNGEEYTLTAYCPNCGAIMI